MPVSVTTGPKVLVRSRASPWKLKSSKLPVGIVQGIDIALKVVQFSLEGPSCSVCLLYAEVHGSLEGCSALSGMRGGSPLKKASVPALCPTSDTNAVKVEKYPTRRGANGH